DARGHRLIGGAGFLLALLMMVVNDDRIGVMFVGRDRNVLALVNRREVRRLLLILAELGENLGAGIHVELVQGGLPLRGRSVLLLALVMFANLEVAFLVIDGNDDAAMMVLNRLAVILLDSFGGQGRRSAASHQPHGQTEH